MAAHRSRANLGAATLTGTAARCQTRASSKRIIIR